MQSKTATLAGILVALTTLVGCAPSPQDVCDHMNELVTKEAPDAPKPDTAECVSSVESKKEMKGLFKYRDWANCVVDATSLEAAEKC